MPLRVMVHDHRRVASMQCSALAPKVFGHDETGVAEVLDSRPPDNMTTAGMPPDPPVGRDQAYPGLISTRSVLGPAPREGADQPGEVLGDLDCGLAVGDLDDLQGGRLDQANDDVGA